MATMESDDGSLASSLIMESDRNGDIPSERMMSMDELKQEMFKSLKDTGTIEAIRAQLRRRFIEKLKQHGRNITRAADGDNNSDVPPKATWNVDNQLVHGLIHEYLECHNMEHTMAVFVPDVGGSQQVLSREAIAQMLRLPIVADGHNQVEKQPLVTILLKELMRRVAVSSMSSATQTAMDLHDHRLALENQLRRVETTYLTECATRKTDHSTKSFEERILRYQREYDEMCEKRLKEDVQHFKATELGLMRVEERRKFEREMDALKTSMFQEHRDRLQRLQDRERELEMAFAAKKAELEAGMFEARQCLFQDIEKLRVKQQNAEAKYNSESREMAMEAKRLQLLEENLKAREENMQAAVDGIVREKEKALQLEKLKWESDAKAREQELLVREHALEEDKAHVAKEKDTTAKLRRAVANIETELESVQTALVTSEKTIEKLNTEKRALNSEIEAREELLNEDKHSMKGLSYENARLAAELKTSQAERSKLDDLVVERTSQLKQLEAEIKELQHQLITIKLDEATAIAEERKKLANILEAEREDARWKENELVGRLRDLQSRLAASEATAEKYQTQYEDEKLHVETLRHEVSSLHELLAQSQSVATVRYQGGSRGSSITRNQGVEPGNEVTERMMMRMMEMMSQMVNMNGSVGQSSQRHSPTTAQTVVTTQPVLQRSFVPQADEEAAKLKQEQERLERELLEQREYEQKKKERDETEQQEREQKRKEFQEQLEQERLEREKQDEEIVQERKRKAGEEATKLCHEIEKQKKALDEAREAQKKLIDEHIAAEQTRLQQERARDEERARLAKEEAAIAAQRLQRLRDEQAAEQTEQESRRLQTSLDTEAEVHEELTSDLRLVTAAESHGGPMNISQEETESHLDEAKQGLTAQVDEQNASKNPIQEEQSDVESFHSEHELRYEDTAEERDGLISDKQHDDGTELRVTLSNTAEGQDVSMQEIIETDVLKSHGDVMPPPIEKSEEELEEERRKAAEEAKRKEDEDALDVYRQRVLARRAVEKQRQQELEEQRKKEEEERAAAELASLQQDESDDEMDKSGGSFASSAASSSGSF